MNNNMRNKREPDIHFFDCKGPCEDFTPPFLSDGPPTGEPTPMAFYALGKVELEFFSGLAHC